MVEQQIELQWVSADNGCRYCGGIRTVSTPDPAQPVNSLEMGSSGGFRGSGSMVLIVERA